jgi:hypothetical protein
MNDRLDYRDDGLTNVVWCNRCPQKCWSESDRRGLLWIECGTEGLVRPKVGPASDPPRCFSGVLPVRAQEGS